MATLIGGTADDPVVLEVVDHEVAARHPSETETEYVIRLINSRCK
jgi:hypothetical protein